MQITIVQVEIEEAIRNHIMSQIQIREGMEIDIDLTATRGAEGFKAIIDIHPAKNPPALPAAQVVQTAQPVQAAPEPAPAAVTAPLPAVTRPVLVQTAQASEPAAPVATASDPAFQEDPPVSERIVPLAAEAESATTEASEGQTEGAPAEEPKRPRSLFGKMKQPVNS